MAMKMKGIWVTDPDYPHLGGNVPDSDPGTFYGNTLWPWLLEQFNPETVLDVGCGVGASTKWFTSKRKTFGFDGLPYNIEQCAKRNGLHVIEHEAPSFEVKDFPSHVWTHDLTKGPFVVNASMIWCCDVVEHIEEQYLPHVLDTLRPANTVVLVYGQAVHHNQGYHHVNNQDDPYWIAAMESIGFRLDSDLTRRALELVGKPERGGGWFAVSGKIFRR